MIRKLFITALLTICAAGFVAAEVAPPASADRGVISKPYELTRHRDEVLVGSNRHTALHYSSGLTSQQVIDRAGRDAETLGLPLVKTLAAGNIMIVEASREEAGEALRASESIPVERISPVYLRNGSPDPDGMVAFTSRMLVFFAEGVGEAQKAQYLRHAGFERLRETSHGGVIVETNREPGVQMIDFAEMLAEQTASIAEAHYEYVITGRPATPSDSIILEDPLFDFQWTLFNSGDNTNFGLGIPDEDIDAPRAWMFNQRNMRLNPGQYSRGVFGSPDVAVAIFDSGTELTHEDLAASLDPRVGIDLVDGGLPLPALSPTGAHGTAIAGIIGAARNDKGIVGVAPGVRLFTVRIFAADYSTTSIRVLSGLQETIARDIDINVHPYTLPFSLSEGALAGPVEQGLRQTFESGRAALGTTNIAAAGNFYSQVEFPAQSRYAWAVGAVTSEGGPTIEANWAGTGLDMVMPSFLVNQFGNLAAVGTGVVVTDLSGNPGLSGAAGGVGQLFGGRYIGLGNIQGFPTTSAGNSVQFLGTSISAAHAAGVTALMLSDNRYHEMSPHRDVGQVLSKQDRRDRAPRGGPYLLSQLYQHADLPSVQQTGNSVLAGRPEYLTTYAQFPGYSHLQNSNVLSYVDQYNEFLGHGRPNPARFTAVVPDQGAGDADGWATPDSLFLEFAEPPFYSVQFGMMAEAGAEFDEEQFAVLGGGWTISPFENVVATIDADRGPQVISPYLEGVQALYFESGEVVVPEDSEMYLYVWTDSITTSPEGSIQLQTTNNLVHNPEGRYLRDANLRIFSPIIDVPEGYSGEPLILTMQLAHNLGTEDSVSLPIPIGGQPQAGQVIPEVDKLNIDVQLFGETAPFNPIRVAEITGDSATRYNERLVVTQRVQLDNPPRQLPSWLAVGAVNYRPYATADEMIIRTYRFVLPPMQGIDAFQLSLQLDPGVSYLPTWFLNDQGEWVEMFNVFRNERGFIFYSASVSKIGESYWQYLTRSNFNLEVNGRWPTWSASKNDVLFVRESAHHQGGSVVGIVDPRPPYYSSDFQAIFNNLSQEMLFQNEFVTSMKGHPTQDIVALTTTNGAEQYVYLMTTDGANQRRLVDPELSRGARDVSWSRNGRQLLYASDDYIRLISLFDPNDGSGEMGINVETVLTSETSFLENFHSPIFDNAAGSIFFTANRKDIVEGDMSLNLYLTTRAGRIISYPNYSGCPDGPEREERDPFLWGWENVNIFDLDLSPSGQRLVFAANASEAPTPPSSCDGMGSGEPYSPAAVSAATSLYTIENFHNVVAFNDAPVYTKVELMTNIEDIKTSQRYPRIAPDGRDLLWTGFNSPIDHRIGRSGVIIRQPLAPEANMAPENTISPTPKPPAPDPTPAPPFAPGQGVVTFNSDIDYLTGQEGWVFRTGGPTMDAPDARYISEVQLSSEVTERGVLELKSRNSLTTFGYWEGPRGLISARSDSLYLYRAWTRTTPGVAPERAPTARLRVNSQNLESAFTAEVLSRGDTSLSPREFDPKPIDLLFRAPYGIQDLPISKRSYFPSFDLVNFGVGDDPNGGLHLDKVDLYRLDDGGLYFAFWSFYAPVNGHVSFTVLPEGKAEDEYSIALRRCCADPRTELDCRRGISTAGLTMPSVSVTAGTSYTLVLASRVAQDFELLWDATFELEPALPEDCFAFGDPCPTGMPIVGSSGSSTQGVRFDTGGLMPHPVCSVVPNRTVVTDIDIIHDQELNTPPARAIWHSGPAEETVPFTNPQFLMFEDSLAMRVIDPQNTFGFWAVSGSAIPATNREPVQGGTAAVYRAIFTLSNDLEPNRLDVPQFRVRLATNDFQKSAAAMILPRGDGAFVPRPGHPRNLEVYLVLEEVPTTFSSFVTGFDILSFVEEGRPVSSQPMKLKGLRIERLDIPDYPATR